MIHLVALRACDEWRHINYVFECVAVMNKVSVFLEPNKKLCHIRCITQRCFFRDVERYPLYLIL